VKNVLSGGFEQRDRLRDREREDAGESVSA